MKATGIVRKVDSLGRVVLPVELRRTFDICEKDDLEIYTEGDRIIIKKYQPGCDSCGKKAEEKEFEWVMGFKLCPTCFKKMHQQMNDRINA